MWCAMRYMSQCRRCACHSLLTALASTSSVCRSTLDLVRLTKSSGAECGGTAGSQGRWRLRVGCGHERRHGRRLQAQRVCGPPCGGAAPPSNHLATHPARAGSPARAAAAGTWGHARRGRCAPPAPPSTGAAPPARRRGAGGGAPWLPVGVWVCCGPRGLRRAALRRLSPPAACFEWGGPPEHSQTQVRWSSEQMQAGGRQPRRQGANHMRVSRRSRRLYLGGARALVGTVIYRSPGSS